ncbi:hypothetical protein LCGC14_3086070 [marine sediment metagenome]|uniref:Uncharacterized protein n=1 Tax=marine sediment metagenome TaxID=412755 RepID=A0A0F8Z2G5_9ZZZZ
MEATGSQVVKLVGPVYIIQADGVRRLRSDGDRFWSERVTLPPKQAQS